MSKKPTTGLLGGLRTVLGVGSDAQEDEEYFPFIKRVHFLDATEVAFYHALCEAAGEGVRVLAKVRLGNLFFPKTGDAAENRRHYARIANKYVDFLICDRWDMIPLLGVELDHSSDQRPERLQRDRFVTNIFEAANLPLMRVAADADFDVHVLSVALREHATIPGPADGPKVESSKDEEEVEEEPAESWVPDSPSCPVCDRPMVLRTVQKPGPHKGKQYWACFAFPDCRGVREYKPSKSARPPSLLP
jgi:hypothetical protein